MIRRYHRRDLQIYTSWALWKTCLSFFMSIIAVETLFIVFCGLHLYRGSFSDLFTRGLDNSTYEDSNLGLHPTVKPFNNYTSEEFLEYYQMFCQRKVVWYPPGVNEELPKCSCVPDKLEGRLRITFAMPQIGEMELSHPELMPGGHWRPSYCISRHRVAIIVPFRDRESHLRIFLHHMHPFLQRQELDYQIFVIEQAAMDVFNKAMMMNIGYTEARKLYNFDCYIFHDVDMIPEDDRNIYACSEKPRHVGSHIEKWNYQVPYTQIFGGAIALSRDQFEDVNGFSNQFYGWGGEDDDMYRRVVSKNYEVVRYPASVARYQMIKHVADQRNPYNIHSGVAWNWRKSHYTEDGLNTLIYTRLAMEFRHLFTWIQAEVPPPPVIWTKPTRSRSRPRGYRAAATPTGLYHTNCCFVVLVICIFFSIQQR